MAENKGTWFDMDSGKVVHSEPVEGVLIAMPGDEVDSVGQMNIDRLEEDYNTVYGSQRPAKAAPKTVTTGTPQK